MPLPHLGVAKLVGEDGDAVDGAATREVQLQLLGRCAVVHLGGRTTQVSSDEPFKQDLTFSFSS